MITNEYINRAIDYILDHITENISIEDVAKHCNFSRYHFSRIFKTEIGESIYEFIKRMKMEQSAFRLKIDKSKSISEISSVYGYSSSNFSSAFKQHHSISPTEFRHNIKQKSLVNPIFRNASVELDTFDKCSKKITIEILEDYHVIYERHKGNYGNLSVCWEAFQEKYRKYITKQTLFLECTYDDPSITDIDECLYDICMTVPENCKLGNIHKLKGGKFVIYHFKGSVKNIYTDRQNIYFVWWLQNNYEIDDRCGFDIYRMIDCDSMDMEIDFCIPVK